MDRAGVFGGDLQGNRIGEDTAGRIEDNGQTDNRWLFGLFMSSGCSAWQEANCQQQNCPSCL